MFSFDDGNVDLPFLRFGDRAAIGSHVEPLLAPEGLNERLQTVYENSMAGALRIRARDGAGVAWLPRSLVAPDLASNALVLTGDPVWVVDLEIRLYRVRDHSNHLTRAIWSFLAVREAIPLIEGMQ